MDEILVMAVVYMIKWNYEINSVLVSIIKITFCNQMLMLEHLVRVLLCRSLFFCIQFIAPLLLAWMRLYAVRDRQFRANCCFEGSYWSRVNIGAHCRVDPNAKNLRALLPHYLYRHGHPVGNEQLMSTTIWPSFVMIA